MPLNQPHFHYPAALVYARRGVTENVFSTPCLFAYCRLVHCLYYIFSIIVPEQRMGNVQTQYIGYQKHKISQGINFPLNQ